MKKRTVQILVAAGVLVAINIVGGVMRGSATGAPSGCGGEPEPLPPKFAEPEKGAAVEEPAGPPPAAIPLWRANVTFDEANNMKFEYIAAEAAPGGVGTSASGLAAANLVQDGKAGVGPANSFELVTLKVGTGAAACGVPESYCGDVEARSFYETKMYDVFVQITSINAGYEAKNSDPSTFGLANNKGLWSYGHLGNKEARVKKWILGFKNNKIPAFQITVWANALRAPVINEVYFDNKDGFTEIYGTPKMDLSAFSLVGINDSNGKEYATIPLKGAIIPDNGLLIVGGNGDFKTALANWVPGQGAIQLRGPAPANSQEAYELVDALAYTRGQANRGTYGEGTVVRTAEKKSITRNAEHRDTQDNAADFSQAEPTPGEP